MFEQAGGTRILHTKDGRFGAHIAMVVSQFPRELAPTAQPPQPWLKCSICPRHFPTMHPTSAFPLSRNACSLAGALIRHCASAQCPSGDHSASQERKASSWMMSLMADMGDAHDSDEEECELAAFPDPLRARPPPLQSSLEVGSEVLVGEIVCFNRHASRPLRLTDTASTSIHTHFQLPGCHADGSAVFFRRKPGRSAAGLKFLGRAMIARAGVLNAGCSYSNARLLLIVQ